MEYNSYTVGADQLLNGVGSRIIFEGSVCDTYPCWNEGTCVPSNSSRSDYACLCSPYFAGDHCQRRVLDMCLQNNCKSGIPCRVNGVSVQCPVDILSEFLASCLTTPCANGGSCVDGSGAHRCACPSPYHGPFCQYDGPYSVTGWSVLEVGLLCLLAAMVLFTVLLICCGGTMGFYISLPQKHYSRWEEGDISDDEEDQEIALGDLKEVKMHISKTSETIVEENDPNAASSSRYGVVTL